MLLLTNIKRLQLILNRRECQQVVAVAGLGLLSAALDALGVASILPFLTVAAQPERIHQAPALSIPYDLLGFTSDRGFLFFLAGVSLVILVLSVAIRALATYAQLRYTYMREYSISSRLFSLYLAQPYSWFLSRHSAELNKMLVSEVGQVMQGVVTPLLVLLNNTMLAIAMLLLGLWIEPVLISVLAVSLGMAYLISYRVSNRRLELIAKQRFEANQHRFHTISESLGAIKELKAAGHELAFARTYDFYAAQYANRYVKAQVVAQAPRFVLEALLFGGVLLTLMFYLGAGRPLAEVMPTLAVLAFAGYRLVPALQAIFGSFVNLRFQSTSLAAVSREIDQLQPSTKNCSSHQPAGLSPTLRHSLELSDLYFQYPCAADQTLRGVSVVVRAGTTVAFVGSSGSGKTTLMDLITGLITPNKGQILVDKVALSGENIAAWRTRIGYVPQQIFLLDDTITKNITLTSESNGIDMGALERAAQMARLHDFVVQELPLGYNTRVGERGVRLSGGQRQRIGIARALYRQPDLLVLDEATSALDNVTEREFLESMDAIHGHATVLMVAHRLSTARHCDWIVLLDQGKIAAQGTYATMLETSALFRDLHASPSKADVSKPTVTSNAHTVKK
jgi:ABC-type bacteriocin/lantibiotic exporter with double-glycine peptidase domain